ncbi:AzlC family ABC transporter permease [Gallibacterium trehalosifermentans]|uniref:AzlC family ABC transporter permease n=1 Tax=Gallibacterium trehalosifermentans TaxID=516935 RepID=A0ABV6H023_9PAST
MPTIYIPSTHRPMTQAIQDTLPVLIGLIPFGLVLGAQATAQQMTLWQVPLMTGINFAGGSEFAAISLWTSPPPLLLIALTTLLVNCRHILMSATLAPYLKGLPLSKALIVLFFMCDESWALALNHHKKHALQQLNLSYYFSVALSLYITWIASSAVGAWLGPIIGDIRIYGLDMAFVAVFLVLLKGMWNGGRAAIAWVVSLVVAALSYKFIEGAWYVPFGTLSGLAVIWWLEKSK